MAEYFRTPAKSYSVGWAVFWDSRLLSPSFAQLSDSSSNTTIISHLWMNEMGPNPSLSILHDDASLSPSRLFDGRRPSRQRGSSSSSSASSHSGSPSSFAASASPSPFHPLPSFAIPFSWEHKPGIPKSPFASAASREDAIRIEIVSSAVPLLLPLPPSFRSAAVLSRKKRSHAGIDPFAAALAECAKDTPRPTVDDLDSLWFRRSVSPGVIDSKSAGIWRWATLAGRLGLYASCKTSCSVSETAAIVRRSGLRAAGSFSIKRQNE